ncbi:MAG TPA: D-alanyl-D-alanine carboxypeptidase/D-alanyl-D-alanine-endopeptidase [Tepidisphaeraceae bacterium]|jgi:D-alanyl-D-alanine carboxypeptidase/D-alanyl-D-alanine-endopeptidase (penicillin-binding protein 4)
MKCIATYFAGMLVLIASVAALGAAAATRAADADARSGESRRDLAGEIKAVLQDKYFNKAEVGIAIVKLGSSAADSKTIFSHESDIPLTPASNLKLLTTSAALDRLGSDFKFKTTLLHHEQDLYLIGDGDPTIGDMELLKKSGWNSTTVFRTWAAELKKRGVTTVRNVSVDDSIFDEVFYHPNWLGRWANSSYAAQIAGVNMNLNCVDFFIRTTGAGQLAGYQTEPPTRYLDVKNSAVMGSRDAVRLGRIPGKNEVSITGTAQRNSIDPISVPVQDPALYCATVLAETLSREGIKVTGAVQRDRTASAQAKQSPGDWNLMAALETPITTVLGRANKNSVNLYAECLCKRLGHEVTGKPGSWTNGPTAVAQFLKKIGAAEGQFHIDDGCGLSRKNDVSAAAMTKLLVYNYFSNNKQIFLDSLGIAGVDGTLEKRFQNSDLRQRVFAKSGYIEAVSSLSGYVKAKDGTWYAFSILMNDLLAGTNPTAKDMQERIVKAVDRQ